MINGSCLCGDITWSIDGPIQWMINCHCSICRKAHGTAYATFVTFDRSVFQWKSGEDKVQRYESSPGSYRSFCGRCGSKLPVLEPFAWSPAGALEGELGKRPTMHMFVGSKAPWHAITDNLKQFESYPPGGSAKPVDNSRRTDPAQDKIRGACLCGKTSYEIDGPLESGLVVSCHCSRCRRGRANPHGSNLFVQPEHFRWLSGEEFIGFYKVPDAKVFGQSFCKHCGAIMPGTLPSPNRKMVPAGSLEDDPGVRGTVHIWTSSKASWEEISGTDPQYAEYFPQDFSVIARTKSTSEN